MSFVTLYRVSSTGPDDGHKLAAFSIVSSFGMPERTARLGLGRCLDGPIHISAGIEQQPDHRPIVVGGGDEEGRRHAAGRRGVRVGAPFEQNAHGFGMLLLHSVLQRRPPGMIDIWKDERALGGTRCVQIDATRGQSLEGCDVTSACRPDEVSMRVVPQIFGRRHEHPAGPTGDGGEHESYPAEHAATLTQITLHCKAYGTWFKSGCASDSPSDEPRCRSAVLNTLWLG